MKDLYLELMEAKDRVGQVPCENAPDMFFIDQDTHDGMKSVKMAVLACRNCPIRVECATYAIEAHEPHGVWGGLTPHERKLIRRIPNPGPLESLREPA